MGYAQGMNDLLARFLVVTDSEVDAYWMFERYMTDKRLDFMESSMMRKVCELLKKRFCSSLIEPWNNHKLWSLRGKCPELQARLTTAATI